MYTVYVYDNVLYTYTTGLKRCAHCLKENKKPLNQETTEHVLGIMCQWRICSTKYPAAV